MSQWIVKEDAFGHSISFWSLVLISSFFSSFFFILHTLNKRYNILTNKNFHKKYDYHWIRSLVTLNYESYQTLLKLMYQFQLFFLQIILSSFCRFYWLQSYVFIGFIVFALYDMVLQYLYYLKSKKSICSIGNVFACFFSHY